MSYKEDSNAYCLQKTYILERVKIVKKEKDSQKRKRILKIYHTHINGKKVEVTINNKVNFKAKSITSDRQSHFAVIKGQFIKDT